MSNSLHPCKACGEKHRNRRLNFSKSKRHTTGFFDDCKKCRNDKQKEYVKNLPPEAKAAHRIKGNIATAKYRSTDKSKQNVENYKERRKLLRNFRNWQKRTTERLRNFEAKAYWTEDQSYFLNDIKKSEL